MTVKLVIRHGNKLGKIYFKNMKRNICIGCVFIFLSCTHKESKDYIENKYIDSISISLDSVEKEVNFSDTLDFSEIVNQCLALSLSSKVYSQEFVKNITETGEIDAYKRLKGNIMGDYEMLPYSILMAYKYDLPEAYADVYFSLLFRNISLMQAKDPYGDRRSLEFLSERERNLALSSLIKAYKKGDKQAALYLSEYYKEGNFFPKDSIYAEKLYHESR